MNPAWLLLLPPVWWMLWRFAGRLRSSSMWWQVCDPQLLRRMTAGASERARRPWPVWILALVLSLGIIAAAGPSWRERSHPLEQSAAARVVVFDLSRSMLVEDVKPNRFAQAVSAVREILNTEYEGETGLVVFAGAAFVVSPLSRDAATLSAFLDALAPDTMPVDGDRIDLAIGRAQRLLDASIAGSGQILIITDGTDDIETATRAAYEAAGRGHRVTVVGVGTTEGAPLQDPNGNLIRDAGGKVRLAGTDFAGLERVARVGNGALIRMGPGTLIGNYLLADPDLSKRVLEDQAAAQTHRAAVNDGAWLVWLMLPFALLLFRKNVLWALPLALWMPHGSEPYAGDRDAFWQHTEWRAFEAYGQRAYRQTIELSRDPVLRGSAYYRMNRYQEAAESFNDGGSAISFYNQGNALARQHKFPDAIVAYGRALELDPALEDAAFNRHLIRAYLEQQAESEPVQSDEGTGEDAPADLTNLGNAQSRIGEAGQALQNPADEQETGPGLGASPQSGRSGLDEQFDPDEQLLEGPTLYAASGREYPPAAIERWLKTLPESSAELFRRKFLRDYRRQAQQQR